MPYSGMDNVNAMLIDLAESRRKVAASMLAGHKAGQVPLTPHQVKNFEAEVAACDAELAELRNA